MKKALLLTLSIIIISCDEKEPQVPASTFVSTASFKLSGDGYNETISYSSSENLIFSQLFSNNEMWIRLAAEQEANGENGQHIDIDLCNYSGSGTYSPIDPQSRPCTSSGWDIWWHDDSKTYFNQANSSPCSLILTQDGDTLSGVFACENVILKGGEALISISEGTFKTLIVRK